MVDHAEDALGGLRGDGVVEHGSEVLEDECDAENQSTCKGRGVLSGHDRLDDHDDERRN